MNQRPNVSILRYPGNYSIDGNKLRIQNDKGMSSVLFEDISSISYKSISRPNDKGICLPFVICLIIMGIGVVIQSVPTIIIGVLGIIGCIIYSNMYPIKWDNVVIETRGGMLLFYSVETGEGIDQVNKIEEDKRKLTVNN